MSLSTLQLRVDGIQADMANELAHKAFLLQMVDHVADNLARLSAELETAKSDYATAAQAEAHLPAAPPVSPVHATVMLSAT